MQKFGHELRRQRAILAPDRFDKIVALATFHAGELLKPSVCYYIMRDYIMIDRGPENFAKILYTRLSIFADYNQLKRIV